MIALPLLMAAALLAQAPAEEPRGSISGHFVSAQTGEPLRGVSAQISMNVAGRRVEHSTLSQADGAFAFRGLAPGTYFLVAQKSGYRLAGAYMLPIALDKNQSRTGLEIRFHRASVITGQVTDSEGTPLIGAEVAAYQLGFRDGRRVLLDTRTVKTDDRGVYRLIGLPAARYLVAASAQPLERPAGEIDLGRSRSFYPSGERPSEAAPLRLAWGQELPEINMVLRSQPTFSISGAVADAEASGPCRSCTVRAAPIGEPEALSHHRSSVGPDGSFRLLGLTPGGYRLVAERGTGARRASGARTVQLGEANLRGVALVIGISHTISGRVVFPSRPEGKSDAIEIEFRLVEQSDAAATARVSPEFTFAVSGLSAETYRIDVAGLPAGGYLKGLRLAGQDLAAPEFQIPEQGVAGQIELLVAFDSAAVSGTVKRPDGIRPPATVVLYPQEDQSAFLSKQQASTDLNGGFRLVELHPGAYLAFAIAGRDTAVLDDPELRREHQALGKAVTLRAGQRETIELTIADPQ